MIIKSHKKDLQNRQRHVFMVMVSFVLLAALPACTEISVPGAAEVIDTSPPATDEHQLPIVIDGMADDWSAFSPVEIDDSGDSLLGDVMDITGLYIVMDHEYYYLMLQAGKMPSKEWVVNFFTDTVEGEGCGEADTIIYVWSIYPDEFIITSADGCGYGDTNLRSEGLFKWEDVLEIRIPMTNLNEYSKLNIMRVTSQVRNEEGEWTRPDQMP